MNFNKEPSNYRGSSETRCLVDVNKSGESGSTPTVDLNQDFELKSPSDSDLEFEISTSKTLEFGDFLLHEKLGEGASAVVFRATHKDNPGNVALKVFRSGEECHLFDREKEVIERLAHPNIALHFGFGGHASHRYVSMELVSGIDLESQLDQKGIFDLEDVFSIVFQIALGLEHAHFRGLVHGDVKPSNIVVDDDGLAKLLDLGVSRDINLDEGENAESPTTVGATVEFMPPEIFGSHEASPASDLFSLGATAYFLLTGKFIVPGTTLEERVSNLKSCNFNGLDSLNLEPDVHAVFEKLLGADLDSRYERAGDLIADLSQLMSDRGMSIPNRLMKILIVEDNDLDLLLTMRLLEKTNPAVEITRAVSLSESIKAIQNSNFDLVLLDLNLPDSGGPDTVVQFAQANSENVPCDRLVG